MQILMQRLPLTKWNRLKAKEYRIKADSQTEPKCCTANWCIPKRKVINPANIWRATFSCLPFCLPFLLPCPPIPCHIFPLPPQHKVTPWSHLRCMEDVAGGVVHPCTPQMCTRFTVASFYSHYKCKIWYFLTNVSKTVLWYTPRH